MCLAAAVRAAHSASPATLVAETLRPALGRSSWKARWKVTKCAMLFDFTTPDMNSAGVGAYASRTMRRKTSGDVFNTQSATATALPLDTLHADGSTVSVQRSFSPSAK